MYDSVFEKASVIFRKEHISVEIYSYTSEICEERIFRSQKSSK